MSSCCSSFSSNYGTRCCGRFYLPWKCGEETRLEPQTANISADSIEKVNLSSEGIFNQLASEMGALKFLPQKSNFEDLDLVRLIYLASLDSEKSPFTNKEVEIFKRSYNADKDTRCWLRFGLTGGMLLIAGGWAVGLKVISDWSENQSVEALPVIGSLFCQLVGGFTSYVSTGSNPDFASNAANTRQDKLTNGTSQRYSRMATTLIDLKAKNLELAKLIASKLKFEVIKKAIKKFDPKGKGDKEYPFVICLEAAVAYVLNKPLPKKTTIDLKNYIRLEDPEYFKKFVKAEHSDKKADDMHVTIHSDCSLV